MYRYLLDCALISLVLSYSCSSESFTRTHRWTNLKDFLADGWRQQYNATNRWDSPVDMDAKLLHLNGNFTDEVWGWKATTSNDTTWWTMHWNYFPQYCGITNATLEARLYFNGNHSSNFLYPVVGEDRTHYLEPNPIVEWRSESINVNLSVSGNNYAWISYHVLAGDLIVIDEVSFTYTAIQNDQNCPLSCSHDCKYRAIDCHHYYICVDRKYKEIHSCSKDQGLAFNPITKTCDRMKNVEGCRSGEPEVCVCAYKPHETNCSSYYYCNDTCHPEECEERQCPSGLLWSVDALGDGSGHQQCVSPENATCHSETTTPTQLLLPTLGRILEDSADE